MVDDEGNIKVGSEQLDFESAMIRLHEQSELAKTFTVEEVQVLVCRGSPHVDLESRLLRSTGQQFESVGTERREFYLRDWAYQRDWASIRKPSN